MLLPSSSRPAQLVSPYYYYDFIIIIIIIINIIKYPIIVIVIVIILKRVKGASYTRFRPRFSPTGPEIGLPQQDQTQLLLLLVC